MAGQAQDTTAEQSILVHRLRLAERLYAFIMIRFAVVFAIVAGALIAERTLGIRHLDVAGLTIVALALLAANLVAFAVVAPFHGKPERAQQAEKLLVAVLHIMIAFDFLCLTIALWLVGGARSSFQVFFIFHVIIASVLLSPRAAYGYALFAYVLFAGLVLGIYSGVLPERVPEGAVLSGTPLEGRYVLTVLLVQALLFVLTARLLTYLMHLLRVGEERLLATNEALAAVSKQRKDFMDLAMHNLRAPLGAIGMHLSNLLEGYSGAMTTRQRAPLERCRERLHEMLVFLKDLEHLVALESQELESVREQVELSEMLEEIVAAHRDLAEERAQQIVCESGAPLRVRCVPRLIREAVVNLVTNALKYTGDAGRITLRAKAREASVRISVSDNGIGIKPEDLKRLFSQFVRVHAREGRLATLPGSGLGLYIVKQIVEMHGGRVGVESELGKGSTFWLELPLEENSTPVRR